MSATDPSQGRIAVIIPVRDGATYLGAAIDSVISQTGTRAGEIVVVDDGSRDQSAVIAEDRAGVRCLRQPPLGVAAALNYGIQATTAPLLAFLDSDDLMTPDSLARRHAALVGDVRTDAVVGRMIQFMDANATPAVRQRYRADPHPALGYVAGAVLLRRTVFDRTGPFDPGIGPSTFLDWVLHARHVGLAFRQIDAIVLERRVHGGNISLDRTMLQTGYLNILRRHFARQRGLPPETAKEAPWSRD